MRIYWCTKCETWIKPIYSKSHVVTFIECPNCELAICQYRGVEKGNTGMKAKKDEEIKEIKVKILDYLDKPILRSEIVEHFNRDHKSNTVRYVLKKLVRDKMIKPVPSLKDLRTVRYVRSV